MSKGSFLASIYNIITAGYGFGYFFYLSGSFGGLAIVLYAAVNIAYYGYGYAHKCKGANITLAVGGYDFASGSVVFIIKAGNNCIKGGNNFFARVFNLL